MRASSAFGAAAATAMRAARGRRENIRENIFGNEMGFWRGEEVRSCWLKTSGLASSPFVR